MRIWTVQDEAAFQELMEMGVYRADPSKIRVFEFEDWKNAYDWLVQEMENRIGPRPAGVTYPVWGHAVYEGEKKEPENRGFASPGDIRVMICAEIPDEEVVLTDFDRWLFRLSGDYIPDVHSSEEFDREWGRHASLPEDQKEKEKWESWQQIFDTERTDDGFFQNGMYVQATFWELRKEQILYYKFFVEPEEEEEADEDDEE